MDNYDSMDLASRSWAGKNLLQDILLMTPLRLEYLWAVVFSPRWYAWQNVFFFYWVTEWRAVVEDGLQSPAGVQTSGKCI